MNKQAETNQPPETPTFDIAFQQHLILAMLLQKLEWAEELLEFLKPEYFDHACDQEFMRIIQRFFQTYRRPITFEEMVEEVIRLVSKHPDLENEFLKRFDEIRGGMEPDKDFQYIRDRVKKFVSYQAMKNAVIDSANKLKKVGQEGADQAIEEMEVTISKIKSLLKGGEEEELVCITVADVEEEAVNWLMPDRVPYDELTIWGGDPGAGKSYLSMWLAAHISAGIPWEIDPTAPIEQGSVLILNTEDSIKRIMRKRLRVNGADLNKCKVIPSVLKKDKQEERLFSLTKDLGRLKKKMDEFGDVRLVIIDLLDNFLGVGVDSNKGTDISAVIAPLKRFAEQNHIAILGLMHLNKNQQSSFIYRLLGSVKLIGIPRVVEFITKDRNDSRTRYFQIAKNNCTDEDWEDLKFAFHKDGDGKIIIDLDADIPPIEEQLAPETKEEGREKHKKKDEAIAILRGLFMGDEAPEVVLASEVKKVHPDIYNNAWGKARKEVGVRSFQKEGLQWWELKRKA